MFRLENKTSFVTGAGSGIGEAIARTFSQAGAFVFYAYRDAAYREMCATQPMNRMGRPEEIAAAALYLASDEAAFVTGESLVIDGGWNAGR